MARRRARADGAILPAARVVVPANPVPGDDRAALARIAVFFRHRHAEAWEQLRLCPLQHGLDEMARLLDGAA